MPLAHEYVCMPFVLLDTCQLALGHCRVDEACMQYSTASVDCRLEVLTICARETLHSQKEEKPSQVEKTYTVIDPRAVMVKACNAPAQN